MTHAVCNSPSGQRGFTLIEAMIASLLGLIVIATVTGVFISTYQANSQNLKVVRMDEDMRATMTRMAREIRRSGTRELAWQTSVFMASGANNPFATNLNWSISRHPSVSVSNSCVLFAYDRDADDGTVEATDRAGYRLRIDNGRPGVDTRISAAAGAACNAGTWESLTDRETWAVTNLNFTTTLEPGATGVGIRTVIVTLDGAVNTRSADPTDDDAGNTLDAADCAGNTLDIVCRRLVEKVRMRNDAIL